MAKVHNVYIVVYVCIYIYIYIYIYTRMCVHMSAWTLWDSSAAEHQRWTVLVFVASPGFVLGCICGFYQHGFRRIGFRVWGSGLGIV